MLIGGLVLMGNSHPSRDETSDLELPKCKKIMILGCGESGKVYKKKQLIKFIL